MSTPILATKLYIPSPPPKIVRRPRLIERLNEGLHRKLTLISAAAGFGKTTLVSEWVAGCERPVAWLSLDAGDNDPTGFLTYLVAAMQTVALKLGEGILGILHATQSQPPPIELLLTTLLNELITISNSLILVLDDYHVIETQSLNQALTFLIEHLPPQLHLVIVTRDNPPDRFIISEVFLARLKLARGDVAGAAAMLAETERSVRQNDFVQRMPEVAAAQVMVLLKRGDLAAAADLAQTYELPISQARVHLARGDPVAALALLAPFCQQMAAKGWQDERLKGLVLLSVARQAHGEKDKAVGTLAAALALARPGGFIRIFLDEGAPMAQLLSAAAAHGIMPDYVGQLLAVFAADEQKSADTSDLSPAQPLIDPLSQRELEILQLLAKGLSNREIGARLFLALDTVKGNNRRIFDKLQVQRRTEAIARARELGLL